MDAVKGEMEVRLLAFYNFVALYFFRFSYFLLTLSASFQLQLLLLLSLSIGFKLHSQQNSVKWPKGNQNIYIYIMYLQLGNDCYPHNMLFLLSPLLSLFLFRCDMLSIFRCFWHFISYVMCVVVLFVFCKNK